MISLKDFQPTASGNKQAEILRMLIPIIIIVAVVVVLYKVISPLGKGLSDLENGAKNTLNKIGLGTSEAATAAKAKSDAAAAAITANAASDFFAPGYYKTVNQSLITGASAKAIAEKIFNADGFFTNDQDSLVAAFKSLSSKAQISQVSEQFKNEYGKDMLTWLTGNFSYTDADKTAIANILNYTQNL